MIKFDLIWCRAHSPLLPRSLPCSTLPYAPPSASLPSLLSARALTARFLCSRRRCRLTLHCTRTESSKELSPKIPIRYGNGKWLTLFGFFRTGKCFGVNFARCSPWGSFGQLCFFQWILVGFQNYREPSSKGFYWNSLQDSLKGRSTKFPS